MKNRWKIATVAALSGAALTVPVAAHAVSVADAWMKAWSSGSTNSTANLKKLTTTDVGANYRNGTATKTYNLQNKNGQNSTVSASAGFTIAQIQLCKQGIPFLPMNCGSWRTK